MFYKIIFAFALVGYITESSSKYGISAQKFNEDYLTNSNKFYSVQFHTSSKPFEPMYEQIFETAAAIKPETNSINYGNIQYAPLDLKTDDQSIYTDNKIKKVTSPVTQSENSFSNSNSEGEQIKKNNIEPRFESESNNEQKDSVVYGHNIQVPQSGNSYPAYNILYRDDNEYTTKDKLNQDNFVNPYSIYHKTEIQRELTSLEPNNAEVVNHQLVTIPPLIEQLYNVRTKQHNVKSDIKIAERVLSEKETPLIQPQLLHARPYRLHLNVARAYNIVHAPSIKTRLINKLPSPSQTLLQKSDSTELLASSDKRTKLVSIQNKYFNRRL